MFLIPLSRNLRSHQGEKKFALFPHFSFHSARHDLPSAAEALSKEEQAQGSLPFISAPHSHLTNILYMGIPFFLSSLSFSCMAWGTRAQGHIIGSTGLAGDQRLPGTEQHLQHWKGRIHIYQKIGQGVRISRWVDLFFFHLLQLQLLAILLYM